MVRVLITEAHEGLGLALVKEYLADAENQVVAFCGDATNCDDLNTLKTSVNDKQLLVVDVNLADEESIKASVKPIEGFVDALDLLIFNPGFVPDEFGDHSGNVPTEIFRSYMFKLRSPRWLAEFVRPLLENGTNSICIGMSLYYRLQDTVIGLWMLDSTTMYFNYFANGVDSSVVTVLELSALESRESLENLHQETSTDLQDILQLMDMRLLNNQEIINRKAKALYENIPKIPYGKHCYWKYMGTHNKMLNDLDIYKPKR